MIDIHSHLIHDVDDGPSSIDESIRMVREAEKIGIRVIIATPHFHESIFDSEKVEENYQELLYSAQDYDVAIKLGYEVFVNPMNPIHFKNRKRFTLNRTGRMLLEFPFNADPVKCFEMISKLQAENIVPVIAHPERYRYLLNNIRAIAGFVKTGCLIQLDIGSIAGVYGFRVKNFVKQIIKLNFADMVASNAHFTRDYTQWYIEAYKNVIQWAGQDYAHRLFYQNARNMLDGIEQNAYRIIG